MQSNRLKADSNPKHPTLEIISKIEEELQYFNIIQ